ncbi:MAG TPA: hypothetical protein VMH22_06465 [bacterium]|nr:hypothetical protein [bacterium]
MLKRDSVAESADRTLKSTARAFHLTNEFGEEGPAQLAALLTVSSSTVAWGPVYPLIKKAFDDNRSLLSPKGFLRLLEQEDGPLKVMARRDWLMDKSFRQHHNWEPARSWDKNFDTEIMKIAEYDKTHKDLVNRRVIIAEEDQGWKLAEERLEGPDRHKLVRRLRALFTTGRLPPRILRRAIVSEAERGRRPEKSILRDILDHQEAIKESGASTTSMDPVYAVFVQDLARMGVSLDLPTIPVGKDRARCVNLDEVVEVIYSLTPITNEKRYLHFVRSPERRRAFRELCYLPLNVQLRSELKRRLSEVARKSPLHMELLEAILPGILSKDLITVSLALYAVASMVNSATARPMGVLPLCLPFVPPAARIASVAFKRLGLVPRDQRPGEQDLECLYHLCLGTGRPTSYQTERIMQCLRNPGDVVIPET